MKYMADDIFIKLDRNLYKIVEETTNYEVSAEQIASGSLLASFNQVMNVLQSGKTKFDNTETGYILGLDKGIAKFYIGDSTNYLNWDGSSLITSGAITGSIITGGTIQTAETGARIIISSSDKSLKVYDTNGDQRIRIGTDAGYIIRIDANINDDNGIGVFSSVSGVGFRYENNGDNGVNGLYGYRCSLTHTNNSGIGYFVDHNGDGGYGMLMDISGAADGIFIGKTGAGTSLIINHSNNTGARNGIDITMGGANYGHSGIAINITSTSAGPVGMSMNLSSSAGVNCYAFKFTGNEIKNEAIVGGATQNKKIRVLIGSSVYYIPLYDG